MSGPHFSGYDEGFIGHTGLLKLVEAVKADDCESMSAGRLLRFFTVAVC